LPERSDLRRLLHDSADRIASYREGLNDAPVTRPFDAEAVRAALG